MDIIVRCLSQLICGTHITQRIYYVTIRALAHTPAFCRSRIRLRSWSFSHVPALPLPAVSLILNAAQRRCLCIDRLRYLKHRQVQIWSWRFSHALALPLPVVSLILNAAQGRCLCIEIGSATC